MRLILCADSTVEPLLRGPLTNAGFEVELVPNAVAVAALCGVGTPPVAVIASVPGPAEGNAFFWEYKGRAGATAPPIIMLLLTGTDADAKPIIAAGAKDVFLAPVQGGRLLRVLRELAGLPTTAPLPAPKPKVAAAPAASPAPAPKPKAKTAPAAAPPAPAPAPTPKAAPAPGGPAPAMKPMAAPPPPSPPAPALPPGPISASGVEVDFGSLVGKKAESAPVAPQGPRWPMNLPPIDAGILVMCMRAIGAELPPEADADTVFLVWKAMTISEVDALKAIGASSLEAPASANSLALAQIAGMRLRVRTALHAADEHLRKGEKVAIDEEYVLSLKQDIDRVMKESLDPIIQWAVTNGELDRMKEFRSIREALSQRRQEIDRAAGKLKGEIEVKTTGARLDDEVAVPDQPVRKLGTGSAAQTRLLEISTVTAQSVKNNAALLSIIAVLLAAGSIAMHVFVFDSFHRKGKPDKTQQVSIPGVLRVEYFHNMAQATVSDNFDQAEQLPVLAKQVDSKSTLVVIDDRGKILLTASPARLQELIAGPNPEAAKPGMATIPAAADAGVQAAPAAPVPVPAPTPTATPAPPAAPHP